MPAPIFDLNPDPTPAKVDRVLARAYGSGTYTVSGCQGSVAVYPAHGMAADLQRVLINAGYMVSGDSKRLIVERA